jgi:hypothetical protein
LYSPGIYYDPEKEGGSGAAAGSVRSLTVGKVGALSILAENRFYGVHTILKINIPSFAYKILLSGYIADTSSRPQAILCPR